MHSGRAQCLVIAYLADKTGDLSLDSAAYWIRSLQDPARIRHENLSHVLDHQSSRRRFLQHCLRAEQP